MPVRFRCSIIFAFSNSFGVISLDLKTHVSVSVIMNMYLRLMHAGGSINCWGYAGFGMMGNGVFSGNFATAQLVAPPSGQTWASLSSKFGHVCAVTSSGAGYCWGYNYSNQVCEVYYQYGYRTREYIFCSNLYRSIKTKLKNCECAPPHHSGTNITTNNTTLFTAWNRQHGRQGRAHACYCALGWSGVEMDSNPDRSTVLVRASCSKQRLVLLGWRATRGCNWGVGYDLHSCADECSERWLRLVEARHWGATYLWPSNQWSALLLVRRFYRNSTSEEIHPTTLLVVNCDIDD